MTAQPITQQSPRGDWTRMVAAVALFTLVAIYPLLIACALGGQRAVTKSDGIWFGIGLFILLPSAIFSSLLCLPAIWRHPRLWWPYVGLVLGLLPILVAAGKIVLRVLGLL